MEDPWPSKKILVFIILISLLFFIGSISHYQYTGYSFSSDSSLSISKTLKVKKVSSDSISTMGNVILILKDHYYSLIFSVSFLSSLLISLVCAGIFIKNIWYKSNYF